MNVFVSQPMDGLTDAQIVVEREYVFSNYQSEHPDAVLLDSYEVCKNMQDRANVYENPRIALLGVAIQIMADADVVIFAKGWEKHPGCRIEEKVATYYDIPRVYAR